MTTFVCAEFPRLCIAAVGRDAGKYLHSQSSNDIESLDIGASRYAFLLEPAGKVIALLRVTRIGDEEYLLDTDDGPGLSESIIERLNRFKIRVDVSFSAVRRTFVAIRAQDEDSKPILDAVLSDLPVFALETMWGDGRHVDVVASEFETDEAGSAFSARRVSELVPDSIVSSDSTKDVEIARVRAGWPAMGREIESGKTIAAATGVVVRAVSFTKGCYPGQELVERMDSRGSSAPRVLRRFRSSDLVDSGDVRVGDSVHVNGRNVGSVTSVAGDWVLAYVTREFDTGEPVSPAD